MTVITTRLTVSSDGAISVATQLPVGEHVAAITIAERTDGRRSVREMIVNHGQWDDAISLRREAMYGNDGR